MVAPNRCVERCRVAYGICILQVSRVRSARQVGASRSAPLRLAWRVRLAPLRLAAPRSALELARQVGAGGRYFRLASVAPASWRRSAPLRLASSGWRSGGAAGQRRQSAAEIWSVFRRFRYEFHQFFRRRHPYRLMGGAYLFSRRTHVHRTGAKEHCKKHLWQIAACHNSAP